MNDAKVKQHALGFYQAIEVPVEEDLRKYYAERYFQSSQGNYRSAYSDFERNYINSKIIQKVALAKDLGYFEQPGRFLDVGCGEGFALNHFRQIGWNIKGLDYSSAGLAAMNPDCLDALEVGDVMTLLQTLIYSAERYEVVWLSNVLEHVPDPIGLLSRLHSLLAQNGLLIVTVPNDFSDLQGYLLGEGKVDRPYWIALPDHLSYFNKESLAKTAEHVGYKTLATLSDFPIDWFLMHPQTNYIQDSSRGREAHYARIALETIISSKPATAVNRFYQAMADIGMGREITSFLAL